MPTIRVETLIAAPPDRCFDLARDVEVHIRSTAQTLERVVSGPASGLLGWGDAITFEAVHFGLSWRLTARITHIDPPRLFVDEQVRGPFTRLVHRHEFLPEDGMTRMVDTFDWISPLGPLGRLADALLVRRHLRRLLTNRALFVKRLAEAKPGA